MKRVLSSMVSALVTLLMGISASASIYDTNYYPRNNGVDDDALRICENMSAYNRNACLETVLGKHFSSSGLQVCAAISVYSEGQKISCLKEIANNAYQADAVKICQTMSDYSKLNCMKAIAGLRFSPEALGTCKAINIYQENSKMDCLKTIAEKNFSSAAVNFCGQLSDFNKLGCMKSSAGNYYQKSALAVCSRINVYMESARLSCMKTVENKQYDERLLSFCATAGDYQINDCLIKIAGTAISLPKFTVQRQRTDLDIVLDTLDFILNGNLPAQRPQENVIVVEHHVEFQKPVTNTCLAREQDGKVKSQTVETAKFYQLAKNSAIESGKCVVARMANTDRSSTLFDATGTQRIKEASYKEIDSLKRESSDLKGKGCYQFICDDAK